MFCLMNYYLQSQNKLIKMFLIGGFPGGPVVRTPCSHCPGLGSVLSGRTKIPQAVQALTKAKPTKTPKASKHKRYL